MSQVDLPTSVGYMLKRAATQLRVAMEADLRDLGLSVPQYSALEQLVQRPGLTNAELARGVFVTRQATHQLLSGLADAGLVEVDGAGRHQRVSVTAAGRTRLTAASARVAAVEQRMLAALSHRERTELFAGLQACVDALQPDPTPGPD